MQRNILIVEDERSIAELISLNLTLAGYKTDIANDGESAIAFIQQNKYDLALLDIMLPDTDGFLLLEKMKNKKIPVIFLTAKNDVYSKVKGLKDGAEDYMVKPFEAMELLARVEKVLSRHCVNNNIISINNVEIDTDKKTVKTAGEEVELKPQEYELLLVLAKNKNMALSREKLLSIVWDINYEGETRTVDVHISRLRKKLNFHDTIKTVSKMGYRLED